MALPSLQCHLCFDSVVVHFSIQLSRLSIMHILKEIVRWLMTWVYFVLVICFIGATLGVITHVLFGLLFVDQPDYGFLAAFGFMNGLKYGSVWAGGLAIVLCVMRARKEYLAKHATEGILE